MHVNALLRSSWAKRENYTFDQLLSVTHVGDAAICQRYEAHLAHLAAQIGGDPTSVNWQNEYTQLLFHGCAEDVVPLIAEQGFLASKQKTAAGSWQRFGPGLCGVCCLWICASAKPTCTSLSARPVFRDCL